MTRPFYYTLAESFLAIPFPEWITKAGEDYEDGGWMQWAIELPVAITAATIYVLCVFLYKMKFQPAPGVKPTYAPWVRPAAALHFGILSIWSIYMFIGMFRGFLEVCVEHGFDVCMDVHKDGVEKPQLWNKGIMLYWFMMFAMSKYYELFDTLFHFFKGYNVIVLHWYHHASVPILCWFHYMDHTSTAWTGSIFNLFVHSVMYTYYALKELRINVINPQIVTTLQLVQFVSVTGHIIFLCNRHGFWSFPMTFTACFTVYVSFFFLFMLFYYNRYISRKSVHHKKKTE